MLRYRGMTLQNPRLRKQLRPVQLTFTRASVAYDRDFNPVPVDTPRFGMFGGPDEGVLVEHAFTNLATAEVSLQLMPDTPYTTGILNGDYTFTCRAGSYTLSGGATGTVTPANPITATINNATVTLTGESTHNQITPTNYPLSWTLGGTTMAAEVLSAPTTIINQYEGTIEVEIYVNTAILANFNNRIIEHAKNGATKNRIRLYFVSANLGYLQTSDNDGNVSTIIFQDIMGGWRKIQVGYGDTLKLFFDGESKATPTNNPSLPDKKDDKIYFLNRSSGDRAAKTVMKNLVVVGTERTDPNMVYRAGCDGFGVDRQVTLIAPLKNNLNAYRVAVV